MLKDNVYRKVLKYYNIRNTHTTFVCVDCMEKALGRKIQEKDINKFPFKKILEKITLLLCAKENRFLLL